MVHSIQNMDRLQYTYNLVFEKHNIRSSIDLIEYDTPCPVITIQEEKVCFYFLQMYL